MGELFTLETISHGSEERSMYGHIGGILRYDYVLRNLKKYSNREGEFLDIGCGQGGYVIEASKLFNRSVGLDVSATNISFCKKRLRKFKLKNCIFLAGEATNLPFSGNKFSVILISEVLEHLPPQKINYVLKEAKRVLIPGGVLLITTPSIFLDYIKNEEILFRNILLSFKEIVPNKRSILEKRTSRKSIFHNFFTKREIENMVSNSGFRVSKICYIAKEPTIAYNFPDSIKKIIKKFFYSSSSKIEKNSQETSSAFSLPDISQINKFHRFFELLPFWGNHIFISALKK